MAVASDPLTYSLYVLLQVPVYQRRCLFDDLLVVFIFLRHRGQSAC